MFQEELGDSIRGESGHQRIALRSPGQISFSFCMKEKNQFEVTRIDLERLQLRIAALKKRIETNGAFARESLVQMERAIASPAHCGENTGKRLRR
jgi:hypothetical protein